MLLYCFRSVTSGLRRLYPLFCAVGQVATFAVNAAFVESVAFVENGRTVREVFPCNHQH